MISKSTIQKVNDSADLLDVVGSFIKLKKRGANYLGNCPFHNEKTPSFTVSPSKGIYKCFGCGKAGNVITFIQEHEKLSYPEAITWLAKRYHIEVEETAVSQETKILMQVEESLRILNTYATGYFHQQLQEHPEGQAIGLSYFKERGFRNETIEKFQLGYCLEDKLHFAQDAKSKGHSTDLLIKAGLVYERNNQYQSMYSGRVIFPIHNQSGKVLGFGARILKSNEKSPKYINTPENELYHKSKTLYGIYFAKSAISAQDECYLVEGYTDVISLHQAGIENVVASSGTSLTEDQLRLIKRYTKHLTILYDGDAAGIKAALRGLDMAIEQGLNVQVVLLPDNHDPDSYVQSVGMEAFRQYVSANKKDIILFKLEASLREADQDSVKKTELINDIADTLSKINKVEDFSKQQDYIRRCAQLLKIEESGLIALVNKKIREKVVKRDVADKAELETLEQRAAPEQTHAQDQISDLLKRDYPQEKGLIRILLEHGNKPFDQGMSIAEYIRLKVDGAEFENHTWKKIYDNYYDFLEETLQYPEIRFFTYHDDESIRSAAIEALYFPYELSAGWEEKHHIVTPSREITFIQDTSDTVTFFLLRKIRGMHRELFDTLQRLNDSDEHEVRVAMMSIDTLKKLEAELLQPFRSVMTK